MSIKNLKEYFPKISNAVGIINFENYYVITHVLMEGVACLRCLVDRVVESNSEIYQYDHILYRNDCGEIPKEDFEFLYKIAVSQIENQGKKVILLNKWNWNVIYSEIIPKEGCSFCYNSGVKNLDDVYLSEQSYIAQDSGKRVYTAEKTLEILKQSLNPLGPVIDLVPSSNVDKLNISVFQSEASAIAIKSNISHNGGKGLDMIQAQCSAIAESIERYSANMFGNEYIIQESYSGMKQRYDNVLDPKLFEIDPNYPYVYSENKVIEWVETRRLKDNQSFWIPANAVFFQYIPMRKEMQFLPQSTTGLSTGLTIEDAVLQGLMEVIERDAYIIYYRNQLMCDSIVLDNFKNTHLKMLLMNLETHNIKVHLKYLRNETSVHVIHCVTEDLNKEFPIFTHGAGASTDPEIAIIRAITEAIQMRISQIEVNNNIEQFQGDESYVPYITWGNGEKEKIGCFLQHEGDPMIKLSQLEESQFNSLKEEILYIVRELSDIGYDVYTCNLSREDCSAKVVRVIVPGYQDGVHSSTRITKRMEMLPKYLGQKVRVPLFSEALFY